MRFILAWDITLRYQYHLIHQKEDNFIVPSKGISFRNPVHSDANRWKKNFFLNFKTMITYQKATISFLEYLKKLIHDSSYAIKHWSWSHCMWNYVCVRNIFKDKSTYTVVYLQICLHRTKRTGYTVVLTTPSKSIFYLYASIKPRGKGDQSLNQTNSSISLYLKFREKLFTNYGLNIPKSST